MSSSPRGSEGRHHSGNNNNNNNHHSSSPPSSHVSHCSSLSNNNNNSNQGHHSHHSSSSSSHPPPPPHPADRSPHPLIGPFGAASPSALTNGAPFHPFFPAGAAPLLLNGGFGAAAAAAAALQQQQQQQQHPGAASANGVSPPGVLDPATLALLEQRPGFNLESTLFHYRLMQHHQKALGKRPVS